MTDRCHVKRSIVKEQKPGEEPRPGSRGACPLAGCGAAPHDLALDLRGGARNPKERQKPAPTSQARQRHPSAPPPVPQAATSSKIPKVRKAGLS